MSEQKIEAGGLWESKYTGKHLRVLGGNADTVAYQYENDGDINSPFLRDFLLAFRKIENADGSPVKPESEYEELPVEVHNGYYMARTKLGFRHSLDSWHSVAGFDGFKYDNGMVSSVAPLYEDGDGYFYTDKGPGDGRKTVWPTHVVIKREKQ